ncbi:MAG TPA: PKD domain-containing protein, partial [Vicinamibacteria bacterium]|nr:PKD domain-containing protein [Vicinamibacteria bacterium]
TNRPPTARLTTVPDPPEGVGPLTVTFDMCASSDPDGDPLSFFFEFGDGTQASGACSQTHTYSATFRAQGVGAAATRSYTFEGNVVDPSGASSGRTRVVTAMDPPTTTTTTTTTTLPCMDPTITINDPPEDSCASGSPTFDVSATAPNTNEVRFESIFCVDGCGLTDPDASVTVMGSGPDFSSTLTVENGEGEYLLTATAKNLCGGSDASQTINFFVCGSAFTALRKGEGQIAAWSSDLTVPEGRLQVVVNGVSAAFPGRGRSFLSARVAGGENRIEAIVVEGTGKPGLWRIDLQNAEAVLASSLRVVAGEVVSLGPTSATFRLAGNPGERIVLTFSAK